MRAAPGLVLVVVLGGALAGCGSVGPTASVAPASAAPAIFSTDPDELALLRGPFSPTPIELSPAAVQVADDLCRSLRPTGLAGYDLAVVDGRGDEIVNVFYVGSTGGHYACENLWINPFGELVPEPFSFSGGVDPSEPVPQPGATGVDAWYGTGQEAPRSQSTWAGPVGPEIAEVRFTAEGKPDIVATMRNGWFALWVPEPWARLTLRGYAADGVEVFATLDW